MLTSEQVKEIRETLESCSNPLFYFDNDQDGLSSYLLLRRKYGKGNGIPVKESPMSEEYIRRVTEFNPDIIFILDQPVVSNEFFEEVSKYNLPIVWIDHHENDLSKIPSFVKYYNPIYNSSKENVPVTALCTQIVNEKKDLWISVVGCVSDKFYPEFYHGFYEQFPDLGIDSKEPFEILYSSEIGKIARMIGSGLKDRTTMVMKMIRFLIGVKSPQEVLEDSVENKSFHKRFETLNNKFEKFFSRAKATEIENNILFFVYSGETSMSADLANKLSYVFSDKLVCVCYINGLRVNASLRGKNIRERVLKIIEEIPGSRGGGHEDAVGLQISKDDLDLFKEKLVGLNYSAK